MPAAHLSPHGDEPKWICGRQLTSNVVALLCGRKLGAAEINMNDLVCEYQYNRAATAKEEDEIDTPPDE